MSKPETITIDNTKYIRADAAPNLAEPKVPHAYPVGENVFVRTVTMHVTGHLEAVTDGELLLSSAAWIADSGRFSSALHSGALSEVEPYPDGPVVVPRGAIIDVSVWKHDLPRTAK